MLRELWKYLTNLGVNETLSLLDVRAIKLMNKLSILMVLWFTIMGFLAISGGNSYGIVVAFANAFLFALVLVINANFRITIAKNYFMAFGFSMVTFINLSIEPASFMLIEFITLSIFPSMIFRTQRSIWAYQLVNITLFVGVVLYHQYFIPIYDIADIQPSMTVEVSILIVMNIVFLISLFFRNLGQDLERKIIQKNSYLEDVIQRMKTMQEQMINSEKMASLGQLTAGIAHEINNPINFVSSNISPLKTDLQELKELCIRYKSLHNSESPLEELKEIETYSKSIEPDFLYQEIETLIEGIEEGANRTKEIVLGMRNFSRVDEDEFKQVDIHEGLDSSLMLLKNKIKNRIEIHKDYGNIPKVDCIPGKINQVFMNILNNAAEAISDKGDIYIKSRKVAGKDKVMISIRDNGVGMPEYVKKRIFEPFYTTKEIGKGTGLGLSISFGIIEKHGGNIEVKSILRKGQSAEQSGTEFIITLPTLHREIT